MESTYGNSSTLSTSLPDESECLVVKKKTKQMKSWDKVTLLKIYFINISRDIFRKIYTIIEILEMYLRPTSYTRDKVITSLISNLVTDSSEIMTLPLILFSLCVLSVAQAYAKQALSMFKVFWLWTLAHSSGICLVVNCFLPFFLTCIIVEGFSRDLVKIATN